MQNRSSKGPSTKGNPINNNYGIEEDDGDEQEYIEDAFNGEEVDDQINDEQEDVVGAGGEMEPEDSGANDDGEDEVAAVQVSGVAAARNRRLKAAKDGDQQPYEQQMPITSGGGHHHQSRLNPLQQNSQSKSFRPASAKAGAGPLDQHYTMPQNPPGIWGQPGQAATAADVQYSYQQMPQQQQQQMMMPNHQGYIGQHPQYVYNQVITPQQAASQSLGFKKRPTTGGRLRNNLASGFAAFNKRMQGNIAASFPSKNPSTLDLEVLKMRPKNIRQERERLYDDVLRNKMTSNLLKDENLKLKTKVHMLEAELSRKEKLVDDLLLQQDTVSYQMMNGPGNAGGSGSTKNSGPNTIQQKIKLESHLTNNLKRKIRELQGDVSTKSNEIEALKRHIKSTKFAEIEVEMKLYMDECARLRAQLEEVIRSKDTFADPQEVRMIEERFQQQELVISDLRTQNQDIMMALQSKDEETRQVTDILDRQKKGLMKDHAKLKKTVKDKARELLRVKGELNVQKVQNEEYRSKIEEMVRQRQNLNTSNIQPYQGRPSTSHYSASFLGNKENAETGSGNKDAEKVKELNQVIQSLNQKLQEKQNEVQRERDEKNRFRELYERYQTQLAQKSVHEEEGAPPTKQQRLQSANPANRSQQNKPASAKPKRLVALVDPKNLEDVFLELRLKLQIKGFYSNQIKDYFFKPYQAEAQVTIKRLKDMFEFNGFSEKKADMLARFLIEPRDKGNQVEIDDERSATQRTIIAHLESSIGHYKLYTQQETQQITKMVQKELSACRDTLKETLELEDYEEEGAIPVSAFKEAFQTLDLFQEDLEIIDFVLYVVYQKSESIEKMRYSVLFELIDHGKVPGLNAQSSEGARKRPESSSPEKLKARNKEKFSGSSGTAGVDAEPSDSGSKHKKPEPKQTKKEAAGDDDYEEEFDQLLDKDDDDPQEVPVSNAKQLKKPSVSKDDEESDQKQKKSQKKDDDDENYEDDQEEDYIDEEEMLDIAERCFMRIAEAILENGVTVRQAFAPFIIREDFEGETLELLSPIGFLEGVKELGVTDLEEVEVACLMRVLTKADLENAILVRELIVIMDNFGIQDDGENGGASEEKAIREANNEDDEDGQQETQPGVDESSSKKKKKKKADAGPALDLSQLDEKSIKILAKLMLALMELNVSLYDFFEGAIYEQLVKTKTKQNTIEIMSAKDFFELLQKQGVRKKATIHDNLQKFLQLDPNYPHLIMVKKIARALDEMAKNEELMEGILAAAMGDMDYAAGDEPNGNRGDRVGGGALELPEGENERLGTIGEDGDEDKQIYDTQQNNNHKNHKKGKKDDDYSEDEGRGDSKQDDDYEF